MQFDSCRIGILGGGQLGRMLIQSGVDLNLDISILDPQPKAPCHQIASQFTCGSITDFDTVYEFGKSCDLISIEIENVNIEALARLESEGKMVFPQPDIIRVIQDKKLQKEFYEKAGIPTSDFKETQNREDVKLYSSFLPAVHKLRKEGYDGRGVQVLKQESDIPSAFDKPSILEKWVDLDKEIAVIGARNPRGQVEVFPPVELVFHPEKNLVEFLFSPARISAEVEAKAIQITRDLIGELNLVGVLAVEMFVTAQGEVLVNESAPRPHNSGHHTIEANYTSQYEQHLRAILNLPLGSTEIKCPAAMVNLLGEPGFSGPVKYQGLEKVMGVEGVKVHLYGKETTKPFRKMGHITIIDQDVENLEEKAIFVKNNVRVIS